MRAANAVNADCPLSPRQLQVLRLVAQQGVRLEDVARLLGISSTTVRTHVATGRHRLGARNITQALLICIRRGWIDPAMPLRTRPPQCRYTGPDRRALSPAQQVYLAAFDEHLKAGGDEAKLERAKVRTDGAMVALRREPWQAMSRSHPSRDWMDWLIENLASLP